MLPGMTAFSDWPDVLCAVRGIVPATKIAIANDITGFFIRRSIENAYRERLTR